MQQDQFAPITVAQFLTRQIDLSGKSQKEIAHQAGYDHPNIITMFKQGTAKVPMRKVGPLARALDVDAALLLRMVMSEYLPDTYAAVEEVLQGTLLSKAELELILERRRTEL